jgi:predicted GH43/DUF377 family glycosyl hydrolase
VAAFFQVALNNFFQEVQSFVVSHKKSTVAKVETKSTSRLQMCIFEIEFEPRMRRIFFFAALSLVLFTGCERTRLPVLEETTFQKPPQNPVLGADSTFVFFDSLRTDSVRWQRADVFNPAAIVRGSEVVLLFRAEDNPAAGIGGRTSRIGLATSPDGFQFAKHPRPVLYPRDDAMNEYEFPGGCEDPRVAQTEDGLYVMTYTAWNKKTARLSIAFSRDLLVWEKKGPAFAKAHNGRFLDQWSKSGSMVTQFRNQQPVLAKVKGKYWMYWGEQLINLAWSENLFDWHPLLDSEGELLAVARPRHGYFDSHLTECGPPAILLAEGVVLLYNGKNAEDDSADPNLPRGTYSVGKLVFDADNLERVVARSESPFLQPSLPHEITGQYQAGTTFAEGLVYFKSRWFLYYGTADSYVGVAVTPAAGANPPDKE